MNFSRLWDDLLEKTAVFVDPEGNVTVSAAHYRAIMAEAGWVVR